MRLSRCVRVDFGYIGCFDDVTSSADLLCSGKHECQIRIPDALFNNRQGCLDDLVRYFEVDYRCRPGTVYSQYVKVISCGKYMVNEN